MKAAYRWQNGDICRSALPLAYARQADPVGGSRYVPDMNQYRRNSKRKSHGIDTLPDRTSHLHRRTGKRFSFDVCCDSDAAISTIFDHVYRCMLAILYRAKKNTPQNSSNRSKANRAATAALFALIQMLLFFH
jgi:hypothetical protein